MIEFEEDGDFSKLNSYLQRALQGSKLSQLDKYGRRGVRVLSEMTPKDTGETASSWYYEIERSDSGVTLSFCNSHVEKHVNIALILNYGHGTGTGGWVQGADYIDPAVLPIFNEMAVEAWREVANE